MPRVLPGGQPQHVSRGRPWQEAQALSEPCSSGSPGPADVSRGSALSWALCKRQAQGRHGDGGERTLRAPRPRGWAVCGGGVSAVRAASRSFSVSEGLTQPDTPLSWEGSSRRS